MLDALRPFQHDDPPYLPGFTGKRAICGQRGPCSFIATEDYDGQVELSLSVKGPLRPTQAQAQAFFQALGHFPLSEELGRGIRHYVMRTPDDAPESRES